MEGSVSKVPENPGRSDVENKDLLTTETYQRRNNPAHDRSSNHDGGHSGTDVQHLQPSRGMSGSGRSGASSDSYMGVDDNTRSDEARGGVAVEVSDRPDSWGPHRDPSPTFPKSTSSLQLHGGIVDGRKCNPKISRARTRHGTPATGVNGSNISSQLRDGTPLYHLSDTIPYLLGTAEMSGVLDAIPRVRDLQRPSVSNIRNYYPFNGKDVSSQDKALLELFIIAEQATGTQSTVERDWLSHYEFSDGKIKFWRHTDNAESTSMLVTKDDIEKLFREWQSSWELFKASEFDISWVYRWASILEHLRARGIDIGCIDSNIFHGLLIAADLSEVKNILDNLDSITNGGYVCTPAHGQSDRPNIHSGMFSMGFVGAADPEKLYSHRFCHLNPSGELLGPTNLDTEQEGDEETGYRRQRLSEVVREGKDKWKSAKSAKKCKWLGVVVLAAAIVGGILLVFAFNVGHTNKGHNRGN